MQENMIMEIGRKAYHAVVEHSSSQGPTNMKREVKINKFIARAWMHAGLEPPTCNSRGVYLRRRTLRLHNLFPSTDVSDVAFVRSQHKKSLHLQDLPQYT